jgi:hypothetical protein
MITVSSPPLLERLMNAIQGAYRSGCPVAPRDPAEASRLAKIALRRWNSFSRRSRETASTDAVRVEDLAKGLRDIDQEGRELAGPLIEDYRHLAAVLANEFRPLPRNPRISLEAAIENLYVTFSRYPLAPYVEGCPHCVGDADNAKLHSVPLRELSAEDLGRFAFKALSTWGTEDDFRHFLPRIFELLPNRLSGIVDPPTVIGKLAYGNWRSWPANEVCSVNLYLEALWISLLKGTSLVVSISADELLSGYSQLFDDLTPLLDEWDATTELRATRHLAEFVERHVEQLLQSGRISAPWWQEPGRSQVSTWLSEASRLTRLEEAFFTCEDREVAALISRSVDQLSWLHSRDADVHAAGQG